MNMKNKETEMKFVLLLTVLISSKTWAVCSLPIIRTSVGATSVLTSTRYNADVNTAYNRVNNLPGDCVVDASITTSKIANGAITTPKIADGAITSAKVAANAIPEIRKLIKVRAYTASGTWTMGPDVGAVYVQVVGGGGAAYHPAATNGSTSTFGGHCLGYGGQRPTTGGSNGPGGLGGIGENGDINVQGASGDMATPSSGHGGASMLGHFGMGGTSYTFTPGGGGGAGGYCAKIIKRENLNASEVINVGAGGTNPDGRSTAGKSGIVFVYEYSK